MSKDRVRVRFAPSPTGYLHIGGVRTALFNWLFARHTGGEFLLRIEDTDRTRHSEEAVEVIFKGLEWLGLDFDGPVIHQADRLPLYQKTARTLIEQGLAYPCYCTPEELQKMREEQLAQKQKVGYDGRCRNRTEFPENQLHCIRFKLTQEEPIRFVDQVYGEICVNPQELDDFVILKADGFPSYNFANVVDDFDMSITHVIRGDDHINNTPRQVLLYQALGYPCPEFAHLPLIVDESRKKLSKRHEAANVLKYREEGVLPDALLNYIAKLGWGYGDQEFFTREELIEKFSLDRVNKSACAIDTNKFLSICGKHMEMTSNERLGRLWLERLVSDRMIDSKTAEAKQGTPWLDQAIATLKIRCKTISELVTRGKFYFVPPESYEEKGAKKFLKPSLLPALKELRAGLEALPEPLSEEPLETLLKGLLEKHQLNLLKLAQPIRLFLTGGTASPGIFEMILLIGKEETLRRIDKGLAYLKALEN